MNDIDLKIVPLDDKFAVITDKSIAFAAVAHEVGSRSQKH